MMSRTANESPCAGALPACVAELQPGRLEVDHRGRLLPQETSDIRQMAEYVRCRLRPDGYLVPTGGFRVVVGGDDLDSSLLGDAFDGPLSRGLAPRSCIHLGGLLGSSFSDFYRRPMGRVHVQTVHNKDCNQRENYHNG